MTICPIHPTNKMHSSLNLSSTRFFNNGTKPHKHKNYGSNKDAKRLSKKTNKKNYISLNMDGNLLNTGMNSWRESDSNLKTNRHDKFYKVVNNEYPSLAKNTLHRGASYVNGVDSPAQ